MLVQAPGQCCRCSPLGTPQLLTGHKKGVKGKDSVPNALHHVLGQLQVGILVL